MISRAVTGSYATSSSAGTGTAATNTAERIETTARVFVNFMTDSLTERTDVLRGDERGEGA